MNYKDYNDFELLDYVRENNEEANEILFKKYEPLIVNMAKKLYSTSNNNCGVEISDLIQEGMLGLSNAINNFNEVKDITFYTYAKTCIERKMISFVISSRRLKHKILNESISLEQTDDNNFSTLEYLLSDNTSNPEVMLLNIENQNELLRRTNNILTDFEKQVFELKINGFEYKEIADILDKDSKSIDNALQRIRLKIKNNLNK